MVLSMTKPSGDEPIRIDLEPETAVPALLEVDPDSEPAHPGPSDMPTPHARPLAAQGLPLGPNEHGRGDTFAKPTARRHAKRLGDG